MGTHPIFESDFDCLTDRKWLLLAKSVALRRGAQLLRVPRLQTVNANQHKLRIAIHQTDFLLGSKLFQSGSSWDVAQASTSALNVRLPSLLTTNQISFPTSQTTTLSLPKPCVPTPASGTSSRTSKPPSALNLATASRPVLTTRVAQ